MNSKRGPVFRVDNNSHPDQLSKLKAAKLWPSGSDSSSIHCVLLLTKGDAPAILTNDEDHLRINMINTGWQPRAGLSKVRLLEKELDLTFARSAAWGFLTASPQNAGHGLRVSALLHTVGLHMSGRLDRIIQSLADVNISVRGSGGERSGHIGHVIQVSNRWKYREPSSDSVARVDACVQMLIDWEMEARESFDSWRTPCDDGIYDVSVRRMQAYHHTDWREQDRSSRQLLSSILNS